MTTFTTEDRITATVSQGVELGNKPYIVVKLRTTYGQQIIYPACEKARVFTKMLAQQTLTPYNISCIKELGYTIKVEQTEPKEL